MINWLANVCGNRDKTISHIISEYNKLAPKEYKSKYVWMGKVIHRELCKKFNFDHANKCYTYNQEYVQENETHKVLCDFGIHTDRLISARRPGLVIAKKEKEKWTCRVVGFAVSTDFRVKFKKSEKRDKFIDLARELKKTKEHDTKCNWCSWYSHLRIGTRTGRFGNKRTSGDHPNHSILKIGLNNNKSPGDLRRLVITKTPV